MPRRPGRGEQSPGSPILASTVKHDLKTQQIASQPTQYRSWCKNYSPFPSFLPMAKTVLSSRDCAEGSALNPEAFQRILSMPGRTRRPADTLTAREKTIAARVALGLSNAEIAGDLKISIQTVKNHLCSIFEKIGVTSRLELASWLFSHDCRLCPLRKPSSLARAEARGVTGLPYPTPTDVNLHPWHLT